MLRAAAVVFALASFVPVAGAHTLMIAPAPRSDNDGLKTGPCGNVAPTATPAMFEAGQTITVQWLETIDHPGYYRIAFSRPGDADFEDNILVDNIEDVVCAAPPCNYSAEVTLPSEPCEGCALQLIQFMGNAAPYSPYFSCADVTLMAAPAAPDAGVPEPGAPDAGVPEPSDGDAGIGEAPAIDDLSGGCAAGASTRGSVLWPLFALVALGIRRRRRARR